MKFVETQLQKNVRPKCWDARRRACTCDILPDLACLPQSIVNLYFVGEKGADDRKWALVDAGLTGSGNTIVRAAAERFGASSRPSAIILTHGHFDHVGDVRELADYWKAPVFAHELELPYITGQSSYPPPDPAVGGGAMSFLSRLYPRGPIDLGERVEALPADGSIPGMNEWRWIHTPGHTAGHVSLFRDEDRTLLVGDAFVTQRQESAWGVYTQFQEVRRPPAYFTQDWEAARRSVQTLCQLNPSIAASGHGIPMSGEQLMRELTSLVNHWKKEGLPSHGRYLRHPAIADERGIAWIPPAVWDPQLAAVLAYGLLGFAGIWLLHRTNHKASWTHE